MAYRESPAVPRLSPDLPPLAASMTAEDLAAHADYVAGLAGGIAEVHVGIGRHRAMGLGVVYVTVYPHSIVNPQDSKTVHAVGWPAAFEEAARWAADYGQTRRRIKHALERAV